MIWAIALGGGAGSVLRYLVSLGLQRVGGGFPMATLVVNVLGSFLIGFLARWFSDPGDNPVTRAALTIGFCGGFTTFSTFSAELVTMMEQGRAVRALLYVVVSVSFGICSTLAGLAVGVRLIPGTR